MNKLTTFAEDNTLDVYNVSDETRQPKDNPIEVRFI
jgi:hypothetical protein